MESITFLLLVAGATLALVASKDQTAPPNWAMDETLAAMSRMAFAERSYVQLGEFLLKIAASPLLDAEKRLLFKVWALIAEIEEEIKSFGSSFAGPRAERVKGFFHYNVAVRAGQDGNHARAARAHESARDVDGTNGDTPNWLINRFCAVVEHARAEISHNVGIMAERLLELLGQVKPMSEQCAGDWAGPNLWCHCMVLAIWCELEFAEWDEFAAKLFALEGEQAATFADWIITIRIADFYRRRRYPEAGTMATSVMRSKCLHPINMATVTLMVARYDVKSGYFTEARAAYDTILRINNASPVTAIASRELAALPLPDISVPD